MDIENIVAAARSMGLKCTKGESPDTFVMQVASESSAYVRGKIAGDRVLLTSGLELSPEDAAVLRRHESALRRLVLADISSYLCLLPIEFSIDTSDSLPRSVVLASKWLDDSSEAALREAMDKIVRSRAGLRARLQSWILRLDGSIPKGINHIFL